MVYVKIISNNAKTRIDYRTFRTKHDAFEYLAKHGYTSTDKKLNTYSNADTGACAKIVVK